MMRLSGRGAAGCVLMVVVAWRQPVRAQGGGGCGRTVALKAGACTELARQIEAMVLEPAVARAHWGIAVAAMDGTSLYGLNEGQLFQPASNAKLFTTAAAMALLGGNKTFETQVVGKGIFSGRERLKGDLVLVGNGDANLSGREIPYLAPALRPKRAPGAPPLPQPDPLRYLAEMADQVAATDLKVVTGDVVGDDTAFPWEPYPEDWAIDDMAWGYGAPVSALSINDNQLKVTVTPGTVAGAPGDVTVEPGVPFYSVDRSQLQSGPAKSGSHVQMERAPGSKVLRVYGSIAVEAQPDVEEVAIHDPAEYAAAALKEMLEERGIVVTGKAQGKHRIASDGRDFVEAARAEAKAVSSKLSGAAPGTCQRMAAPDLNIQPETATEERTLARHQSVQVAEDVVVTNKVSQNLHAELLLHRVLQEYKCGGSTAEATGVVRAFLTTAAGIDGDDFVFFDGSGLSGHDLVTPRATVKLLQFASTQPWFADWKKSLPVGGIDGSLEQRFTKAPLRGKVFAKTGTLGEARALSGYVEGASGQTVIFSIMVGNHAPRNNADREMMDRIVAAVAAAN